MAVNNSLQPQNKKNLPFSVAIRQEKWQDLIHNTLGNEERAGRFVASITSAVAVSPAIQTCDAGTVLSAALLGEVLNLSPSPQLGHFYMVPYKQKEKRDRDGNVLTPERTVAQFQIGYKGMLQLANGDCWKDTGYLFTQDDGRPMNPTSITAWLRKFSMRRACPISIHTLSGTVWQVF